MSWYWIILIITVYIVMWIVTGVILSYVFKDDDVYSLGFLSVMWPLCLIAIPFYFVYDRAVYIIKKFGYKKKQ